MLNNWKWFVGVLKEAMGGGGGWFKVIYFEDRWNERKLILKLKFGSNFHLNVFFWFKISKFLHVFNWNQNFLVLHPLKF